jgi:hypothetical protein
VQQVRIIGSTRDKLGIRNEQADWWIAKRCLGSDFWVEHGLPEGRTTGPGYISLVVQNGVPIVDDDGEPIDNGHRNSGGLGSFAYQHSRGIPPFTFARDGGVNTWFVTSRVCSGDHMEAPHRFGVTESCCLVGPLTWDGQGGLHWWIDVDLRTPWQNPILQVRYEYTFLRARIEVVTKVHTYCGSDPRCGDPFEEQFLKEPKFTAEVVRVPGDSDSVYDPADVELVRWTGADPHSGTAQSADDARDHVRFAASGLNIVARGYRTEPAQSFLWEGDGYGLDQWAVVAAGYERPPSPLDGPAPPNWLTGEPTRWDCNDTEPPKAPDAQGVRQWELVGGDPFGLYPLAVYFHSWEGGVGPNDCEPVARHFPPADLTFANEFIYTIEGHARVVALPGVD